MSTWSEKRRPLRSVTVMACVVIVGLFVAGGCGGSASVAGTRHTCECTYLTDFDDTFHIDVDVCVRNGGDLQREAATCAAENAHNHVDQCNCVQPVPNGKPIDCDAKAKDRCFAR